MSDSVIIDPLTKDDHAGVYQLVHRERIRLEPYFPVTCSRCSDPRSTRTYIKELLARRKKHELHCFVMRDYEGGDPIGLVFLKEFDWSVPKCETAYFVSSTYERRGLTTMALMWTLDFAFGTLGLAKVYARVAPDNIASCKVLENCGFQREGLLRQDFRTHDGRLIDLYLYGRLK